MADSSAERPPPPPQPDSTTSSAAATPQPQHADASAQHQQQSQSQQSTPPSHQPPNAIANTPTQPQTTTATPATTTTSSVQREIPAAKIRSGLSDLERHTTQVLHRLENLRTSGAPHGGSAADAAMSAAFLPAERRAPAEIFGFLESLIARSSSGEAAAAAVTEDDDDDDAAAGGDGAVNSSGPFALPALDDVSHLALLTHTLCAYMAAMDYRRLARLTAKICSDTQRWLAHMFRFIDATASYHPDGTDALLRAVRLALVTRCPGWLEGGVAAAASPCLYGAEGAHGGLQFVCRQLGLPVASAVRAVPLSGGRMDCAVLQKLIAMDAAAGRTPLFLVAECGGGSGGYVDDLARLQTVCRANGVWMHCRGHALAAIAIGRGAAVMEGVAASGGAEGGSGGGALRVGVATPLADSMTLSVNGWLGLPNLPVALLHRPIQNVSLTVFESDPVLSRRLSALSLWTTLQALGRDSIADRLGQAFEASRQWYEIVASFGSVRILSKPLTDEARALINDADNRPLNYAQLFDTAITCVIFQFDGHAVHIDGQDTASANADSVSAAALVPGNPFEEAAATSDHTQLLVRRSMERVANSSYFDKLNSWLAQNMQRDCPDVDLEMIEHPTYGTCMRFCPFELALGQTVPDREQLELAAQCLEVQIDILRATVRHRGTLQRLVAESDVLRLVALPDWAGLGGVRFVPDGWERLLTGDGRVELNRLNVELVEQLRSTDNAFSMGEGADGLVCVRFGMVTEDTDVEELLDLVVSVGARVQENSKVLDTMAEIVKKGIETATADLQRESEEKLWSEGILRHVPVFGQVVNWWSPPVKETGIKGRSLNLTQGVVESTENIYKYHMQLSAHNQPIQGSKSPPAPLVQTSVSAGHSRNVSQGGSSNASATVTASDATQPPTAAAASLLVAPQSSDGNAP